MSDIHIDKNYNEDNNRSMGLREALNKVIKEIEEEKKRG